VCGFCNGRKGDEFCFCFIVTSYVSVENLDVWLVELSYDNEDAFLSFDKEKKK